MARYKLKYLLKSALPTWAMPYARAVRSIAAAWSYWSAYVFMDGRARPPAALTMELTYRCNLRCNMCPQAIDLGNPESVLKAQMKENRELRTEEIIDVIEQAARLGVKRVTVTGGEPFLRKDIMDILYAVKRNRMTCNIISNGGLFKEGYAEKVVAMGVDKIIFSLDGPEEVHNNIRNSKNLFNTLLDTVRNIQAEKVRQKCNVPDITFNTTISALNAGRLSELVPIAAREGVNLNYGFLFYATREMEEQSRSTVPATGGKVEDQDIPMSIRGVDVDLLAEDITQTEDAASRLGIKINIQPYIKTREELRDRFYNDAAAYVHHCFYPWYAMRVNPYGDVYPCQMNVLIGNVRNCKLGALWNNDIYVRFRKELRRVGIWPKCTKCCVLINKLHDRLPQMRWYWNGGTD